MEQLKGFIALRQEKKVCKLVKSLYGLKQPPKQWHERFGNIVMSNDFKINEWYKCIYAKSTPNGYVIVWLYMDDTLIFGSNNDIIRATKKMLTKHFDMKDMGIANIILGIKISKTSNGLVLSQSHYTETILRKFNKYEDSLLKTPIDVHLHLAKNISQTISQLEYSRVIGSLMYIMNSTRSNIAHAVNKLSRFTNNLGKVH